MFFVIRKYCLLMSFSSCRDRVAADAIALFRHAMALVQIDFPD